MGFYYTRYCWWPTVLRIGGDGCHNIYTEPTPPLRSWRANQ
ncbi:unnamed protein product [Brassica rapa subsp. trilocularis]